MFLARTKFFLQDYRLIFREFEACRKLREVHTRLGVLCRRSLDVGRPRSTNLSFWSEFEVSFDVISKLKTYVIGAYLCDLVGLFSCIYVDY